MVASIGNINIRVGLDTSEVSTRAPSVGASFKDIAASVGMTEKQFLALNAESKRILRDMETDAEKYQAKLGRLDAMKATGLISPEKYDQAKAALDAKAEAPVKAKAEAEANRVQEEANRLQAEAQRLYADTRTKAEGYAAEVARVAEVYRSTTMDADTYTRALTKLEQKFQMPAGSAAELAKLDESLRSGAIDAEAYARGVAKLDAQSKSAADAAQQLSADQADARRVFEANKTAAERYEDELRRLEQIKPELDKLSPDAYSRARKGIQSPDQAEAKRLYDSTRTSAERYAVEEAKVNALHRRGAIDAELHGRAIAQLKQQFMSGQLGPLAMGKALAQGAAQAAGINPALLGVLGPAAAVAASFMAIKAAVGTVAEIIGSAIDRVSQLNDAAGKLGTTTEALAGIRLGGQMVGVDAGSIDNAMSKMNRAIAEGTRGGESKDAFKELGLDAKQLEAMAPEQALEKIADAMASVDSASERTRLAMAIFGRGGADMINVLAGGSAGLKAAAADAQWLGVAVGQVDADRIDAAGDAIDRLKMSFEGMGNSLAAEVAPAIEAATTLLADLIAQTRGSAVTISSYLEQYTGAGLGSWAANAMGVGGIYDFLSKMLPQDDGSREKERQAEEARMAAAEARDAAVKKADEGIADANEKLATFGQTASQAAVYKLAKDLEEAGISAEEAAQKVEALQESLSALEQAQAIKSAVDATRELDARIRATQIDADRLDLDNPFRTLLSGQAQTALEEMRRKLEEQKVPLETINALLANYQDRLRTDEITRGTLDLKKGIADLKSETGQLGMTDAEKQLDNVRRRLKELGIEGTAGAKAIEDAYKDALAQRELGNAKVAIRDTNIEASQVGMTDSEKAVDNLRRKFAALGMESTKEARDMEAAFAAALGKRDLARGLQDAKDAVRDLAQESRQVGMNSWERAVDDMAEKYRQMRLDAKATAGALKEVEAAAMKVAGRQLTEQMKTPVERFRDAVKDIQALYAAGAIDKTTAERAIAAEGKNIPEASMAGAAFAGSREAYSAIVEAQNRLTSPQAELVNTAKQHLELGQRQADTLEAISSKLDGGGVVSATSTGPQVVQLPDANKLAPGQSPIDDLFGRAGADAPRESLLSASGKRPVEGGNSASSQGMDSDSLPALLRALLDAIKQQRAPLDRSVSALEEIRDNRMVLAETSIS